MATVVLIVGISVFAAAVSAIAAAIRLCRRHPAGAAVLLVVGGATSVSVVLLWLDGRVQRYFAREFWIVVSLAPVVGAAGSLGRRRAAGATAAWIGLFALVFASRLRIDAAVGSAAAIGLLVETVVVACYCLPPALLGAALEGLTRKHLSVG